MKVEYIQDSDLNYVNQGNKWILLELAAKTCLSVKRAIYYYYDRNVEAWNFSANESMTDNSLLSFRLIPRGDKATIEYHKGCLPCAL